MKSLISMRLTLIALLAMVIAASLSQAQTYSVLYNFGGLSTDPLNPNYTSAIAQGQDGNLYTTSPRGSDNVCCGTVFKVSPAGAVSVIYYFAGLSDGDFPQGGLTLGSDGNFYGTTNGGNGTVFKITPQGTLTTLHTFTGGSDGGNPYAPPIEGTDGNFYGTTTVGGTGAGCPGGGCGVIYKITPAGTFKTLHQIAFSEGQQPRAPLVLGSDGNFYGTTTYGTSCNCGTVFKVTSTGKLTVLYTFDITHGSNPIGPLIQGADGNFYGTTQGGGAPGFNGEVFKITPGGSLNVLYSVNGTTDGAQPYSGLVLGSDGNFYGTNAYGGTVVSGCGDGCGTFFQITPQGAYTVLHSFDLTDGATPQVSPFQHTNGIVYGDTYAGGTGAVACQINFCGVFYGWADSKALPAFVNLMPYWGKVGQTIGILGQGFVSGTTVSFNGKVATSTVLSSGYLMVKVPSGATSGPVTVTTSGTPLTSNRAFLVTPKVAKFSPTSGPVGTAVTITGVSLTQTTKVTFGGVAASSFTVNSDKQVTATVPTGAQTGHIAITTEGGVAVSKGTFTVK